MNKKYPVGIQNFEGLRKGNYCYIDKTALIYQLVSNGKYYFLSRPRRFGKSLLISTLEAYFSGKRELFSGLAMETLEKDWIAYPVLHMDLNTRNYDDKESLIGILNQNLEEWEKLFNIYNLRVGQILLTRADLESRERYLNARDTLFSCLEMGVVPIINENDAVGIAEIKVGDNYNLAALSAVLIEASQVILLTDQKGLDLILDSKNSFHLFSFNKSLYKSILSPT